MRTANITVDGKTMQAEFIGKGAFSKAYRVGDYVYCFTNDDAGKACLTLGGEQTHLPSVAWVDTQYKGGEDISVYKMPFYAKLTAANKVAWQQATILRKIAESVARNNQVRNIHDNNLIVAKINEVVQDHEDLPDSLKSAVDTLINNAWCYGSTILLEFGRANLGVDGEGNLVLRDCVFDQERLIKVRQQMARRAEMRVYGY